MGRAVIELIPWSCCATSGTWRVPQRLSQPLIFYVRLYAWQCLLPSHCPLGYGDGPRHRSAAGTSARTTWLHPLLYHAARRVMDLFRVNEFVFALMFVTAVGLGPLLGCWRLGFIRCAR
jgi:hypothetical protein